MTYYPNILSKLGPLHAISTGIGENTVPLIKLANVGINRAGSKFGDAVASASAISEAVTSFPFFLDICDDPSSRVLSYDYILRPNDGYENWCSFVMQNFGRNCRPIVQFSPEDPVSEITLQVNRFITKFSEIGIRVPYWVEKDDLTNIAAVISDDDLLKRITFFVDIGQFNADQFLFCMKSQDWSILNDFKAIDTLAQFGKASDRPRIVPFVNSFPRSIVVDVDEEASYGGFSFGERQLTDRRLFEYINSRFGNVAQIEYGDYVSINQEEGTGGRGWIPRVDLIQNNRFQFFRQRTQGTINNSLKRRGIEPGDLPTNNAAALQRICQHIKAEGQDRHVISGRVKEVLELTANGRPPRADAGFWTGVRMIEHLAQVSYNEK